MWHCCSYGLLAICTHGMIVRIVAFLQIIFVNTFSDGIVLKIKLHFVAFCYEVFINWLNQTNTTGL